MSSIVSIQGLGKTYDNGFQALKSVDLDIESGEIFALLKTPGAAMTKTQKAAAKTVLNSLDRVAFLTQAGWLPDETVMPWMHPMIHKSWKVLEAHVLAERESRNEPYYYEHAEDIAKRCQAWREKHNIPDEVIYVEGSL